MTIVECERQATDKRMAAYTQMSGDRYEYVQDEGQYNVYLVSTDVGPVLYGVHKQRMCVKRARRNRLGDVHIL